MKNIFKTRGILACILTVFLCHCGQDGSKDGGGPDNLVPDSDTQVATDSDNESDKGPQPEPNWISLEFVLGTDTAAAGSPVSYTATLQGDDGSTKPAEVVIESDQEANIAFDTDGVTATLAEIHNLTATATEKDQSFTATTVLTVLPGEPVSIVLQLLPTDPEVDTPLFVLALIKDAYGNICENTWSLDVSAEPGSDASTVFVDGENLIFTEDGWFTLIGTVDSNGITGTLGPFLVDSYGPLLTVTEPERGRWSTEYEGTVKGNLSDDFSDVTEVTVNGEAVDVDEEGAISGKLEYEFGLNAVQTLATDKDGNVTSDRRSVLAGTFKPQGSGIGNGIQARINGPTIAIIEEAGENLVESANLNDFIPDPVYQDKKETCINIPFVGKQCITWYELRLRLSNVTFQNMELTLDPRADGAIAVTATIFKIHAPWSANGVVAEIPYSASGSVSADSITIKMHLRASVLSGNVSTSISNVEVSSVGFKFDFNSWIYDAAQFFGINVDGIVQGFVEDAIEGVVKDEVPKVLEGALHDLSLKLDFDLLGATYDIEAKPYAVSVDNEGLTLGLETFMNPKDWTIPLSGEGSLYYGYESPSYGANPGLILGFSADFLCQALYAFWGGGLLHQTIELGKFELPMELPFIPSTMDNLHIVVEALLPPVVVPGTDEHLMDLQLGDAKINLYSDDPSNPDNLFAIIYVGFDAELDLTISDQNTLAPRIGDVVTWFDLVYPALPNGWEINLETLADAAVDELIPLLYDAIGSIPVPSLYGLTIGSIQVEKAGAENGYVTAGGELIVQ